MDTLTDEERITRASVCLLFMQQRAYALYGERYLKMMACQKFPWDYEERPDWISDLNNREKVSNLWKFKGELGDYLDWMGIINMDYPNP